MSVDRLNELETIGPRPLPPWRLDPFTDTEIDSDRETARERADAVRSKSDIVVYHDGQLGPASITIDENTEVVESQQVQHQRKGAEDRDTTATILCDSKSALQAIQNVEKKSGQRIVHAIHHAATEVQAAGVDLRLQWVPGHCDDPGNDAADQLAKDAASPGKSHSFRPLLTRERAFIRSNIIARWEQEWRLTSKGGHLRRIDNTLPWAYTRKLYGNLARGQAYLLTQLRTGHNWLSTYAKLFGFPEDDQCVCGAQETSHPRTGGLPNREGSAKGTETERGRRIQQRVESAGRLKTR